jgi:hypothetical protein
MVCDRCRTQGRDDCDRMAMAQCGTCRRGHVACAVGGEGLSGRVQRSPGLCSGWGSRRRSGRWTLRGRRRREQCTVFSVTCGRTYTCWGSHWRIGWRRRREGSCERRRGQECDGEWSGRRKGSPALDRIRRRGARKREGRIAMWWRGRRNACGRDGRGCGVLKLSTLMISVVHRNFK